MAGLFDDIPSSEISTPQRAFLNSISAGESSGDYGVIYGGGKFDDFSDHPRKPVPIQKGPNAGKTSSAAGRYQFLKGTWDEAKNALGLPDFSPESQDKAAVWLAGRDYRKRTGRDLWSDVEAAAGDATKLNEIGSKLSGTWTSLPSGIERNSATAGFGQRVATELSGQSRTGAPLFDDIPSTGAPSGRPKITINRPDAPQTDPQQRLLLETQNEMAAASQRTTPSIAAHKDNLISTKAFEGDDGNVYYEDPVTGQLLPTDQNKHVAIRDPQDNTVKIFERTENTDEGMLSAAGRLARIGTAAGAPTRLPMGVQAAAPAVTAPVKEGQLVAQAAERLGVDLPRAVTSDRMGVQQTGKIVTNVPIGGTPLREASRAAIGQLDEAANATQAAYGSGSVASAGSAARQGITSALEGGPMKARVDQLYRNVDDLVNPTVVGPLSNTRNTASSIAARRVNSARPGSRNVAELEEALARPGLNYEGIKDLRTYYGEMLKGKLDIPQGMTNEEVKQIYGALSKDMRLVIAKAGGAEGLKAYDKAERVFKRWADIRESLTKILRVSSDEAAFDKILGAAGSTSRADSKLLGRIRAAVGTENWDEIAAGVISKLGRDADMQFSPDRFLTAYGKLSKEGKDMLFRTKNHASHADALDDIATISRRIKSLNQFANPSGTAQSGIGGAMGFGVFADPVTVVTGLVSARVLSTVLAKPASARSMAAWSRAYERAVKAPTAGAVEGFRQASKLFATNIGRELGTPDLIPNLSRQLQGAIPGRTDDE